MLIKNDYLVIWSLPYVAPADALGYFYSDEAAEFLNVSEAELVASLHNGAADVNGYHVETSGEGPLTQGELKLRMGADLGRRQQ